MTLNDLMDAYVTGGGTLTSEQLRASGPVAWSHLHQQTMGRIETYQGDAFLIHQCFVELVDTIHKREGSGVLASETMDDWSQTYTDPHSGQTNAQVYTGIIRRWLSRTGLLYRGCP